MNGNAGKKTDGGSAPVKPGPTTKKAAPKAGPTRPLPQNPFGPTNPAPLLVPVKPQTRQQRSLNSDLNRRPGAKDSKQLVKKYGMQGALLVQRERVRRSVERMNRQDRMMTPLTPYYAPPSFKDNVREALGGLLYGGSTPEPRMSPIKTPPVVRAGIGGADLAVRPINVWGYSALQAAAHPKKIVGDVRELATGTAQALGAGLAALQNGDPSILKDVAEATVLDYQRRYGENWKREARKDPLYNLMDAAAVASTGLRLVEIAPNIAKVGLRAAVKQSYNPGRAGIVREVTDELGQTEVFNYGSSPIMRAIQDGYDAVSQRLPGQIKLGKDGTYHIPVPGSAARRVARQQTKNVRRQHRRDQAVMSPLVDFVKNPASKIDLGVSGSANAVARIRLFWESQLPEAFRNNEGLTRLRDALENERAVIANRVENPLPGQSSVERTAIAGSLESPDAVGAGKPAAASVEDIRAVTLLSERIAELDAAIAWTPNERYLMALDAVDALNNITEDVILRGTREAVADVRDPSAPPGPPVLEKVTGDAAIAAQRATFSSRKSRIPEWLGMEGEGAFIPHRSSVPEGSGVSAGFNPNTGTVVVPSDRSRLKLNKRNDLELMKTGAIAPDPELLIRHANAATGLSMMDEVRDTLWQIGQDVPLGSPLPQNGFLVRERTAPIPDHHFRDLASDDAVATEKAMDSYRKEFLYDRSEALEQGWARRDESGAIVNTVEGARWVPNEAVERLVHFMGGADARKIMGRATKGGQAIDVAENLVKIAVLYTNPGYYAANLIGNMVFLGLQSNPVSGIRALIDSGLLHQKDPATWQRVGMEMGEGPAAALLSSTTGTGMLGAVLEGQRKVAVAAGVADRGPRIAAWIHEARGMGYKNAAAWKALLDADGPEATRIKNLIQERASRAMVDFDQMLPFEKTYLRRLIFVYPWIRGSTVWAAKFGVEKPGKAALLGAVGQGASAVSDRNLGGDQSSLFPNHLGGAFVTGRHGPVADVVNATTVSPFGTLKSVLDSVTGATRYDAPYDLIHPLLKSGENILRGEDQYGRHIGSTEALKNEAVGMVPFYKQSLPYRDPGSQSRIYADTGLLATLMRRGLRVGEYGINVPQAKESAAKEIPPGRLPTPPTRDYADWKRKSNKFAKQLGIKVPDRIRAAGKARYEYQLAQRNLKDQLDTSSLGGDNLSENAADLASARRQAALKIGVLRNNAASLGIDKKIADVMDRVLKEERDPDVVNQINNDLDDLLGFNDLSEWNSDVTRATAANG